MKNLFVWIGGVIVFLLGAWAIKESWGNPDSVLSIVDPDNLPDYILKADEYGAVASDNLDFAIGAMTGLDAMKEQLPIRRIHHAK